jgi:membrane protein
MAHVQERPGPVARPRADGVSFRTILVRAAKKSLADNIPTLASAIAYSAFLTIPSILLVAVGVFGLVAGPDTVHSLVDKLGSVMPADAARLLDQSLTRVTEAQSGTTVVLTVVGILLAFWSLTGAMGALMWGLNLAEEREDKRRFVTKRVTGLAMAACVGVAFVLSFGLLVLGPHLSHWVGDAVGAKSVVTWLWWAAQWPILVAGLLLAFGAVLYLGPAEKAPKLRFITPGAITAVMVWLVASGAFAVYTSRFGSYNKTWGSVSAVIVLLTWLWLSSLALLFGAEVNAEVERARIGPGRKPVVDTGHADGRAAA